MFSFLLLLRLEKQFTVYMILIQGRIITEVKVKNITPSKRIWVTRWDLGFVGISIIGDCVIYQGPSGVARIFGFMRG